MVACVGKFCGKQAVQKLEKDLAFFIRFDLRLEDQCQRQRWAAVFAFAAFFADLGKPFIGSRARKALPALKETCGPLLQGLTDAWWAVLMEESKDDQSDNSEGCEGCCEDRSAFVFEDLLEVSQRKDRLVVSNDALVSFGAMGSKQADKRIDIHLLGVAFTVADGPCVDQGDAQIVSAVETKGFDAGEEVKGLVVCDALLGIKDTEQDLACLFEGEFPFDRRKGALVTDDAFFIVCVDGLDGMEVFVGAELEIIGETGLCTFDIIRVEGEAAFFFGDVDGHTLSSVARKIARKPPCGGRSA